MTPSQPPGYLEDKQSLLRRLSRIEGQVRGIQRMVGEEAYCIDVLTQVNAVKAAIDQVALRLLEDHAKHCVAAALQAGDPRPVDELMSALGRFARG